VKDIITTFKSSKHLKTISVKEKAFWRLKLNFKNKHKEKAG